MSIHHVPERFSLRPATPRDEEFLRLVYAESRRAELSQVEWPPGALDAFLRMQFDMQRQQYSTGYPGAESLIVEVEGVAAGRFCVQRTAERTLVIDIALLPGFRGLGIGGEILRRTLEESHAAGKPLVLHVEKNNPALSLYLRLGLKPVEDQGVYWKLASLPD